MGILSWLFGDTVIHKHYYDPKELAQHEKDVLKIKEECQQYNLRWESLPVIDYKEGHEFGITCVDGKYYRTCMHCGLEELDVDFNEIYCLKYHFMPKKDRHGNYHGPESFFDK
jgi:hypothetical protein